VQACKYYKEDGLLEYTSTILQAGSRKKERRNLLLKLNSARVITNLQAAPNWVLIEMINAPDFSIHITNSIACRS
jgi:hypothetical protein